MRINLLSITLSKCCINVPYVTVNNVKLMSTNIPRINNIIQLEIPLIKDSLVLEAGQKIAICRCWKSLKFPQCDGAHNKHNTQTGDNVGPFIVAAYKNN